MPPFRLGVIPLHRVPVKGSLAMPVVMLPLLRRLKQRHWLRRLSPAIHRDTEPALRRRSRNRWCLARVAMEPMSLLLKVSLSMRKRLQPMTSMEWCCRTSLRFLE